MLNKKNSTKNNKRKKHWWSNDLQNLHSDQCSKYQKYARSNFEDEDLRKDYAKARTTFKKSKKLVFKLKVDSRLKELNKLRLIMTNNQ